MQKKRATGLVARFLQSIVCLETGASAHQESLAGALDRIVDLAVETGGNAGCAAGENLAGFGDVALEKFGILPVDGVEGDVHATARHGPVGLAEVGAALGCFWQAHVT